MTQSVPDTVCLPGERLRNKLCKKTARWRPGCYAAASQPLTPEHPGSASRPAPLQPFWPERRSRGRPGLTSGISMELMLHFHATHANATSLAACSDKLGHNHDAQQLQRWSSCGSLDSNTRDRRQKEREKELVSGARLTEKTWTETRPRLEPKVKR